MSRIESLSQRVRWLDRYRRVVAITVAIILVPVLDHELAAFLGPQWPDLHRTLLVLMISTITWWTIEVGLAWLAAVWETEADRLTRDTLPRAIVHRK